MSRASLVTRAPEWDWLLVTKADDIAWLTGFRGSTATTLVSRDGVVILLVDGRYSERAAEEAQQAGQPVDIRLVPSTRSLLDSVTSVVGSATVGVDPSAVTATYMDELGAHLRVKRVTSPFVDARRVKDAQEIDLIARCADIADQALADVIEQGLVGFTERKIRRLLEARMFDHGADDVSFPTIVAAGPNASRPHHEPGDRIIVNGDAVIIDMGASVHGYRSDMTRTVLIGDVGEEIREMHGIVREAQQAGVDAVRAGVGGADVDRAVRDVFARYGTEHEYLHGTGHGVGLVIHEQPILGPRCSATLLAGEVVTVEPGLYRVGVGGVRIEDLVVVTDTGCRILTQTPKELSCPQSARTI